MRLKQHFKKLQSQKIRFPLIVMGVSLLMAGIYVWFYVPHVAAEWFNDAWHYRQKITVTGVTSQLSDYQIQITGINTKSLYDSGKLKANCEDIRFLDISGNLLDYWAEDNGIQCKDNTATDFWIRVPNLYTNGTYLYMYYGNQNAVAFQDGKRTFIAFDDFSSNLLRTNIWDTSLQTPTIASGEAVFSGGSILKSQDQFTIGSRLVARVKQSVTNLNSAYLGLSNTTSASYTLGDSAYQAFTTAVGNNVRGVSDNGISTEAAGSIAENDQYEVTQVGVRSGGVDFAVNNVTDGSISTNVPNEALNLNIKNSDSSATLTLDWIAVTKYSTAINTSQSLGAEEKGTGPILYLSLDEGQGATAYDLSGHGNNATLYNSPVWTDQCVSGKCLSFNGVNSYGLTPLVTSSTTNISMSVWLYFEGTAEETVPFYNGWYNGYGLRVGDNGCSTTSNKVTVLFSLLTCDAVSSTVTLNKKEWTHIVLTRDATTWRLYKNGKLASIGTGNPYGPSGNTYIGGWPVGANFFNGKLDEIKFYDYQLSTNQILNEYNNGAVNLGRHQASSDPIMGDRLLVSWKMNETSGSLVKDYSKNAGDGTATGTTIVDGYFEKARNFPGSTVNNIRAADSSIGNIAGDLTISMWIRPVLGGGLMVPIHKDYQYTMGIDGNGYVTWSDSTGWSFGGFGYHDIGLVSNKWQNLTVTKSNGLVSFYLDGVLKYSGAWGGKISPTANILFVGNYADGNVSFSSPFNGDINNFLIFNRELAQSEITKIVKNEASGMGLQVDYKMDESEGSVISDSSSNSYHTTATGTTIVAGYEGNARNFNGTSDYAEIPAQIKSGLKVFTIDLWIKTTESRSNGTYWNRPSILGDSTNGPGSGDFGLTTNNGYVGLWSGVSSNDEEVMSGVKINDDNWHRLTVINDGQKIKLYVDALDANTSLNSGYALNSYSWYLGSQHYMSGGAAFYHQGIIDNFRFYDRVIYPNDAPGLIARWQFDQYSGSTLFDSSLHALNGNINGSPQWQLGKIGNALHFDGSSNYAKVANNPMLNSLAGQAFTIDGWFKAEEASADKEIIVNKGALNNNPGFAVYLDAAGKVVCEVTDSTNISKKDSIASMYKFNDLNWHTFKCVKKSNSELVLFVDDVVVGRDTSIVSTGSLASDKDLTIAGTQDNLNASLLHFNAANNSTNFIDQSGKTVTAYGNAKISNTQSKFGGTSGEFNQSSTDDYLKIPASDDFNFGDKDFTIDLWTYFTANDVGYQILLDHRGSDSPISNGWVLYLENNNTLAFIVSTGGSGWNFALNTSYVPPTNQWVHIAVVRSGSRWNMYVNGVSIAYLYSSDAIYSVSHELNIGKLPAFGGSFRGYMDELRISKGVARWLCDFVPPLSENAIIKGSNGATINYTASAFLHLNGDNNSQTIVDDSGKTWTVGGDAKISTAQARFGGASAYFDGVGDYISTPDSTDWEFGSNDFSVDFWFNLKQNNIGYQPLVMSNGSGDYQGWVIYLESNNTINFASSVNNGGWNAINMNSGIIPTTNEWHHFALTRKNNYFAIYYDGILVNKGVYTGSIARASNGLLLGRYEYFPGGARSLNGYIDEVRIVKGTALWAVEFTPETSEHPNSRSPVFPFKGLLDSISLYNYVKLDPVGSDDKSFHGLQNDPSLVGYWKLDELAYSGVSEDTKDDSGNRFHATSLNGVKSVEGLWGGKAASFNGNNAVIRVNGNPLNLSSSITVSAWVKTSTVKLAGIVSKWDSVSGNTDIGQSFTLYENSDGTASFIVNAIGGGDVSLTSNKFIADGNWHLVTATADKYAADNNVKLYVDGIIVSQANLGTAIFTTSIDPIEIGATTSSAFPYFFSGLIDDVRIYNRALGDREITMLKSGANNSTVKIIEPVQSAALKAYWKFDQSSWNGTIGEVIDSSGNGLSGKSMFGANTSTGQIGNAATFDGVDDYVSLPTMPVGTFTHGFSISFWANPTSNAYYARIIDFGNGVGDNNIIVYREATSNNLGFHIFWGQSAAISGLIAPNAFINNEWHFYTITHALDGTTKIFRDGVELASGVIPLTQLDVQRNLNYIAKSNWGSDAYYQGKIDEVMIFNKDLSVSDIQQIYTNSNITYFTDLKQEIKESPPAIQFKFDEKSGDTAQDSIKGLSATLNNFTGDQWIKGKIGNALKFDGVDDYAQMIPGDTLNGANQLSISFWFKTNAWSGNHGGWTSFVDGFYTSGTGDKFSIRRMGYGINLIFFTFKGVDCNSNIGYTDTGNWHHVATTWNGNKIALYIDGVEQTCSANVSGTFDSTHPIGFGRAGDSSEYFNGVMDNLKIWRKALTARDVALEYNAGAPIGYWKFDEGEGSSVHDYSGNTAIGTMNGNVTWTNNCKLNGCVYFDGASDWIDIPNSQALQLGTNDYSVSLWLKYGNQNSNGFGYSAIYIKSANGNQPYDGITMFASYPSAGNVQVRDDFNNRYDSSNGVWDDDKWHHFTIVRTGGKIKLYVDGSKVGENAISLVNLSNSGNLRLGANHANPSVQNYKGYMDELRIFNYALSDEDIKREYNLGAAIRFE